MRILIYGGDKMRIVPIFSMVSRFLRQNRLIYWFIFAHTLFAIFLGRLFALAPDEGAYLYTFNNLYGSSNDASCKDDCVIMLVIRQSTFMKVIDLLYGLFRIKSLAAINSTVLIS